jgi:hypothetical protein
MIESGEIKVSRKTLLHVSEGIYRTFGSALKELVNNAFDANANEVIISTNSPLFDVISIKDDGDGMELSEFKRIVEGGIGDSLKLLNKNPNRPMIGKLGIGILATAQICRSFTIISHHKESRSAFKGRMIFNMNIDKVEKSESVEGEYPAGKWELDDPIEYDENKKGVLLFTDDLRMAFKERFKLYDNLVNETPVKFEDYFKKYFEERFPGWHKSVKELDPYNELIWELTSLLPIKYMGNGPVRDNYKIEVFDKNALNFIRKKQQELVSYDFNVIIDNISLSKFINLPFPELRNNNLQECQLFYLEYQGLVSRKPLKFFGYIFAQEYALYPRELKGIQIRIKNVGIGLHDPSFLSYKKIESPRDNWITGEIYVEEGLESALNIDRDSFNENDEQFYFLRKELHNLLEQKVFPTVREKQKERNKNKRLQSQKEYSLIIKKEVANLFKECFNGYSIKLENLNQDSIVINKKEKIIILPLKLTSDNFYERRNIFVNNLHLLFEELTAIVKNKQEIQQFISKLSTLILS